MGDPRTPAAARIVAFLVVAYALSPIDLIPDFVPVLGQLDDLLLVPLGILLAIRLVPAAVLDDCRVEAARRLDSDRPGRRFGLAVVVATWVAAASCVALLVARGW